MIEVKNLRKSFNGHEVLKGISAVFEKGKTNMIIGQSGSGKTVFLKSILGLITPDSGEISFDGRIWSQLSPKEQAQIRKEIGVVFQGNALFDSYNIEENISFPLRMFTNKTEKEIIERVNEVLEQVALPGINKKYPAEISGGQQKRVAIARAIVMYPKYLFADEPNSGLDPKTAIRIDDLLHDLTVQYDTTTLINTHDMNSIMEIGEKIILLKDGVKAWEGTKDDIFFSDNPDLNDFIFSSELFRKVKEVIRKVGGL
ncbi:MAG: ATP-binding cassette domain-containing protein [Chlorobi bacterium]|nr:ATP-binding cassette domain-containing protein [Chlorobiota bacterium]